VKNYTELELKECQRRLDAVGCPVDLASHQTVGPGGLIIRFGTLEALQTRHGWTDFLIEVALQSDTD